MLAGDHNSFFFSSRRRHTRFDCDWSSDVCSSDLVSLHWFSALFGQQRTGDFAGSFTRSIVLAVIVLAITVVVSVMAGLAFRRRFLGSTLVFYMAIFSLIIPGLLLGLGVGLMVQFLGIKPSC